MVEIVYFVLLRLSLSFSGTLELSKTRQQVFFNMATSNIESELASLQRIHERIQSARNEELASMLTLLLPRLIILTNQEALRIKAMAVLSECMKRIKLAALPIDTTKLLDLVRTQFLPFAPNLAITFVDITLEHSKAITDVQNAAAMLIAALPQFDAFTNASNSLCFYALLHFSIGIAKHFETQQSPVNLQEQSFQTILGDFALDICFLQRPQLAADVAAVGSVQPGLSVTRLDRLVTKKKSWSASDLKSIKLIMINLIASKVFLPHHAVLISVILSNDVDAEVSAQANFKMNGCVNILSIDTSVRTATEVCTAVLALCSSDEQVHKDTPVAHRRSTIKAEVRLSALRWLGRHLPAQLGPSAKAILMLVFRAVFNPAAQASGVSVASSLTEEVAVVGAALQLLDLVLPQVVDDQQFTGMVLLVSLCVKKILQSFAYSASSFSAGEHHTTVRSCCYRIAETIALRYVERSKQLAARSVEELALRNAVESSESVVEYISLDARAAAPASTPTPVGVVALSTSPGPTEATVAQLAKVTVEDADLLMLLFQLLDREHAQRNESSIVALYRAMNSLRDAFLLVQKSSVADGGAV